MVTVEKSKPVKKTAVAKKPEAKKPEVKKEKVAVVKTEKRTKGRPTQYTWDKWFDIPEGKIEKKFTLKTTQYHALQSSMCVMIRQNAKAMNLRVSVFPQEDGTIKVIVKKN